LHTKVLLIDAVDWGTSYQERHPLKDVGFWFKRHFPENVADLIGVKSVHDVLELGFRNNLAGIIMSGSPRDAHAQDQFTERAVVLVQEIQKSGIPFFGVCYGHQLLARALGGEVAREPNGLELGNAEVELTDAGMKSFLFEGCAGPQLNVLQSHRDAVLKLPPDAELLAGNKHSAHQSFRVGKMHGVQFHPETSPEVLEYLWTRRIAAFQPVTGFDIQQRISSFQPTPQGVRVLQNFVYSVL